MQPAVVRSKPVSSKTNADPRVGSRGTEGGQMSATIIDGKRIALELREEIALGARALTERGVGPGLAVVLVGDDPASAVYVRNKDRAAQAAGFDVRTLRMDAGTSLEEILGAVDGLNRDPSVHGILVQLPLPRGIDSDRVVRAIDPRKDVDGLHPLNVAALVGGTEGLLPCTPSGVMVLIERAAVELEGRRVVVIGRSMLVGKPVALLALARHATVTICHSRTRDLAGVTREADVVIAAVGRARMVRGDWIRPGACVIDVGINRGKDGKLVGDVDFIEAREVAGSITPVPGGVGPMTIAMLLENTALAAARQNGLVAELRGRPARAR
jgi:methylenetetrahydrofolate dehydrogenase (NADP+)/methenyltetrahydrofolate cyclohydrolase